MTLVGGAIAAAAALAACTSPAGGPDAGEELSGEVVWADYGGSTNETWNELFFDGFTEQTGVDVVSTTIEGGVMYGMLDGGAGDYDAFMVAPPDIVNHKENLLELPEGVNRNDTLPEELQPYALGTMWVGYAQGYLASTFPDGGPTTWADFWDVETYPGKRAVPGVYSDYMYEAALLADGVAPEDLYPIDFERATKKLDELKPNLVFYADYPDIKTYLTNGTASIAFGPTGQYTGLKNQGVDVTINWDGAFVEANPWVVPVKAPNPENIFALADYLGDPETQAAFAEATGYGPGNAAAFEYIDADKLENLANAPDHTATITVESAGRAADFDRETEEYAAWLTT